MKGSTALAQVRGSTQVTGGVLMQVKGSAQMRGRVQVRAHRYPRTGEERLMPQGR